MAEKDNADKYPANEELIESMTEALEAQFNVKDEDKSESANSPVNETQTGNRADILEDFDQEEQTCNKEDDYIDEEHLKDLELTLTDEDRERRYTESLELKKRGNDEFKTQKYLESVYTYTEALRLCPLKYSSERSIFYANRAASKISIARKESAIEDCTKAIELNDKYVRAYLRRARLYEESDKLDESLEDYKKILEIDKGNKDALQAQYRLPPLIAEKNEKLKTEMLGKLKDLGNMILKPFGLSTENFQMNKDPNSGGYSLNFSQNK